MTKSDPGQPFLDKLNKKLVFSRVLLGLALLAWLVASTSINKGLQSDDYIQQHKILLGLCQSADLSTESCSSNILNTINQLFVFTDSNAKHQNDFLPWWAHENLHVAFWRPIPSMTHIVDYVFWPKNYFLMHLHNIFYFSLLIVFSTIWYRKLFADLPLNTINHKQLLAPFAGLILCLDFSFYGNISWIANRNSLIATCFSALCLIQFHQLHFSKDSSGNKSNLLLSLFFFLGALLSSETSVVILLWLSAYLFCFKEKNVFLISKNLFPFFLTGTLWLSYYILSGYGILNSELYLNPIKDFDKYFSAFFIKGPIIIFSQISGFEGFYNVLSPKLKLISGLSCGLLIFIASYSLLKKLREDALLVFLVLSCLSSILPLLAYQLIDIRFNFLLALPWAALLSLVIYKLLLFTTAKDIQQQKSFARFVAIYLISAHLIVAGFQWGRQILSFQARSSLESPYRLSEFNTHLSKEIYAGKNIILLNTPSAFDHLYLGDIRKTLEKGPFGSFLIASHRENNFTLTLVDEFSMQLSSDGLNFNENRYGNHQALAYSNQYAHQSLNAFFGELSYGEALTNSIDKTSTEVKILSRNKEGQISKVLFTFKDKISSDSYVFLRWNTGGFEEVSFSEIESQGFENKATLRTNSLI